MPPDVLIKQPPTPQHTYIGTVFVSPRALVHRQLLCDGRSQLRRNCQREEFLLVKHPFRCNNHGIFIMHVVQKRLA